MIYTGDIESRARKTGARTAIGDVSVTNREANARAALPMKAPALAAALKTQLLACGICRSKSSIEKGRTFSMQPFNQFAPMPE